MGNRTLYTQSSVHLKSLDTVFGSFQPFQTHNKRSLVFPRLGFRASVFAMSFPRLDELKRKNRDCS